MSSSNTSAHKEKKVSDKDLDLSNADRGVWLVKVPKYMADRWETCSSGTILGKLTISRKPGQKASVDFSLAADVASGSAIKDSSSTLDQLPKEHKFIMGTVTGHSLSVFSHTAGVDAPDKLSLEGKVVQRAECRPINDTTYMKLKHKSFVTSIQPQRTTVQLDNVVQTYKPVSNHASNILYSKEKKKEGKKSRDDKDKVMDILFGLFEKHQYYNIGDLAKATRQPLPYLKEILKEVCTYNVKNPHKNMWELKPEYRHYKVDKAEDQKDDDSSSSEDD